MQVKTSRDQWNGKPAYQVLFSFPEGWNISKGGPRGGEAVVVIGFDRGSQGFEAAYIRSYASGAGYARKAYEWLRDRFGALSAVDVVDTGVTFHHHMLDLGILRRVTYAGGHSITSMHRPSISRSNHNRKNFMPATQSLPQTQRSRYIDFLVSRLFERNDFGTSAALIAAIENAIAIDPNENWRMRKDAFNQIAEKAPMTNSAGYLLRYEEIPAFVAQESAAMAATFDKNVASPMVLEQINVTADGKVGLSRVHFQDGEVVVADCDWGNDPSDRETSMVTMLLYGSDGACIDRASMDGDTWREIEQQDVLDFYSEVFSSRDIKQAIVDGALSAPSM